MRRVTIAGALLLAVSSAAVYAEQSPPAAPSKVVAGGAELMTLPQNTCAPPVPAEDAAAPATPPAALPEGAANPAPALSAPAPVTIPDELLKQLQRQPVTPQDAAGIPSGIPAEAMKQILPIARPEVVRTCNDGAFQIKLAARFFGHRIGDKIPVMLELRSNGKVRFDFHSIEPFANGSEFELASRPFVAESDIPGGRAYRVFVDVQSMSARPWLDLVLQMRYASAFAEDGTPFWQPMVTPNFILLKSNTAELGMSDILMPGNVNFAHPRAPWAVVPAWVLGLSLIFGLVLLHVLKWVNRVRPRKVVPPKVAAWIALDRLVTSGNQIGFSTKHYESISGELKRYLRVLYPALDTTEPSTVESQLSGQAQARTIASALSKLEAVVYRGRKLRGEEHTQLVNELRTIVPRPLTI